MRQCSETCFIVFWAFLAATASLVAAAAWVVSVLGWPDVPTVVDDKQRYKKWKRELDRLSNMLNDDGQVVSCGSHLADTCTACTAQKADDCLGDCLWSNDTCLNPIADMGTQVFAGLSAQWATIDIVDTTPLSTAMLTIILAGANPRAFGSRCQKTALGSAHPAAAWCDVPLDAKADVDVVETLGYSDVVAIARLPHVSVASPLCLCEASASLSPSWLGSRLTGPSRYRGAAMTNLQMSSGLVALLRDPLEAVMVELLPNPQFCTAVPQMAAPCQSATLELLANTTAAVRFNALLHCCRNPMARALVGTLPMYNMTPAVTAAILRCATGQCTSDAMLYGLSRRALLRLSWFGTLESLGPSLRLLEARLGLQPRQLAQPLLRRAHKGQWPRTVAMHEAALSPVQVAKWRMLSAVDVALYHLATGTLAYRLRAAGISGGRGPRPYNPPVRNDADADTQEMVSSARVFGTDYGSGRTPAAVVAPVHFRRTHDTLVFVHLAKCGGTSFNVRLTSLDVGLPCECHGRREDTYHNGHPVVQPRACTCLVCLQRNS